MPANTEDSGTDRTELDLNRLRWRSRRGMRELDLLLVPFYDEMFRSLTKDQQDAYVELLAREDPQLLMWFNEQGEPDEAPLRDLVRLILERQRG